MKRIISERKTTLLSLSNQDLKTVKVETEKINELLIHISTNNITELNKLIHAGAKLVSDKICLPPKGHEQKLKTWTWNQTGNTNKKTSTTSRNAKTKKNPGICWDEEQSNTIKTNDTNRRDKSEGTGERKKTIKIYRKRIQQYRQNRTFQNNPKKFYP